MSTEYILTGIDKTNFINFVNNSVIKIDMNDGVCMCLYVENSIEDKRYTLRKRVELGKILNVAPDNLSRASDKSTILVEIDGDIIHLWGFSELVSNPEIIIDKICELANRIGYNVKAVNEYDDEFKELLKKKINF